MEKIFIDFTEEEKISVVKEKARQTVINDLIEYLKERYDMVGLTNSNQIAIVVGQAKDQDGFNSDVCTTIKVSCESWYDKTVNDKGEELKRPVSKFDFEEEIEAYKAEVAAKKAPKK
jgi:hypothetical protein